MTELEKLKDYLDKHGYVNYWNAVISNKDQIIVYEEYNDDIDSIIRVDDGITDEPWEFVIADGKKYRRSWDVICHKYSYGGDRGLLEIMAPFAENEDGVVGYLTAEDVINKYLEVNTTNGI